ncbi:MAG: MutS-related protein, partial [Vulcanimicrobiaceae bacterium]
GEPVFLPGDEARARAALARVDRLARALAPETAHRLQHVAAGAPDPLPIIVRAEHGEILDDFDFFELGRLLDALAELREPFTGDDAARDSIAPPDVATLRTALGPGRGPARSFYVADAFDAALAGARGELADSQSGYDIARGRTLERIAAFAGLEHARDGEFILMRDRVAGPLPAEIRVVREAATYLLCEPALDDATQAAAGRLERAAVAVADAEQRVRGRLSAAVSAVGGPLRAAAEALGALDSLLARVRFAQKYATCVPAIHAASGLQFTDGRHLPLAELLTDRGRPYRAISLDLPAVAILTGPNMGGKSAALRTGGFIAACVARGVPVPAAAATLGLYDEIAWLGNDGDGDSDRNRLLSSFGREVVAVRELLERPWRRGLILIDEFARTTTPVEGRALLLALLERLCARDACVLAATHLPGIARDASAQHFVIAGLRELPADDGRRLNLDQALARIAGGMDYRIRRAGDEAATRADAVALAQALGLDSTLIERARTFLNDPGRGEAG